MPLIRTATYLLNIGFSEITGLFDSLDCLGHLTKMTAEPPYMVKQNMFYYKQ